MNNILEITGLSKSYPGFSLQEVCFSIPQGYIMGFIGANGAGKTTTIKAILNMIRYEKGTIGIFGGQNKEKSVHLNEQIGIVMDLPFYVNDWKCKDVERALSPFYSRWDHARYTEYLERFQISPEKRVKELSRGMKVKLMLAVALSHGAKLLILDEPTSGLDPVARDELLEILQEFVMDKECGILFSTHITSDLEKIADYITFIKDGKIIFTGPKDYLLKQYVLVKGGLAELTPEIEPYLIGIRRHNAGFEAMALREHIGKLSKELLIGPISLDEMMVIRVRGEK